MENRYNNMTTKSTIYVFNINCLVYFSIQFQKGYLSDRYIISIMDFVQLSFIHTSWSVFWLIYKISLRMVVWAPKDSLSAIMWALINSLQSTQLLSIKNICNKLLLNYGITLLTNYSTQYARLTYFYDTIFTKHLFRRSWKPG